MTRLKDDTIRNKILVELKHANKPLYINQIKRLIGEGNSGQIWYHINKLLEAGKIVIYKRIVSDTKKNVVVWVKLND